MPEESQILSNADIVLDILNSRFAFSHLSLSSQGIIIDTNSSLLELLGYSREEMVGRHCREIIPQRYVDVLNKYLEQKDQNNQILTNEIQILRKDGHYLHAIMDCYTSDDHQNNGVTHCVIYEDVIKPLKVSTSNTSDYFTALINSITIPIHIIDQKMHIVGYNAEFVGLLKDAGITSNCLGKSMFTALPFINEKTRKDYEWVFKNRKVQTLEEHSLVNGREFHTLVRKVPIIKNNEVVQIITMIQDITENRKAEQALEESTTTLQSLQEGIPIGLGRITTEGRFLYTNPAFLRIFGYDSFEELSNLSVDALYTDPGERKNILQTLAEKGVLDRYSIKAKHRNGNTIWVSLSATLVREDDKESTYSEVIVEEITERKHAEQALAESESRYRNLVELSPDAIIISIEGKIAFINSSGAELLAGGDTSQLIDRPLLDFIYPDSWTTKEQKVKYIEGRDIPFIQGKFINLQGQIIFAEVASIPFTFQGQQAVQVIIHDISDRKLFEEALRESEERYRSLVETSPDAIVVTDLSANIIIANKQTALLLGYETAEDLISKSVIDFVIPEQRKRVVEQIKRTLGKQKVRPSTYSGEHPNGENFAIELSISTIMDTDGNPKELIVIARDVSERVLAEEVMRESEERYRNLLELSFDMIFINSENRIIFVNQNGADFLGAGSTEELLGRKFTDFLLTDAGETNTQIVRKLSYDHAVSIGEQTFLRLDGKTVVAEAVGVRFNYKNKPAVQIVARDITKRKTEEDTLRHSEELFRLMTENAGDMIYRFRMPPHMGFEYVSPSVERHTGYGTESFYSDTTTARSFIVDEDFERIKKTILSPKEINDPVLIRLRNKEGQIIWTEHRITRIYNSQHKLIAIEGVARDITDHIRVTKQLQLNEARLSALLKLSQMTENNTQEVYSFVLGSAIDLTQSQFGFLAFVDDQQQFVAIHSRSAAAGDELMRIDKPSVYKQEEIFLMADAVKTRKPVIINYHVTAEVMHSERRRKIDRYLSVPVIQNDQIVAVVGVANKEQEYVETDVTQLTLLLDGMMKIMLHKQHLENLRQSTDTTLALLNATRDVALLMDVDGIVLALNDTAAEQLGLPTQDCIGRSIFAISHPSIVEFRKQKFQEVIATGVPMQYEEIRPGRYYENIVYPVFDSSGMISRIALYARDKTEQINMKEQLEEQQKQVSLLLNSMPGFAFLKDLEYRYITANESFCVALGKNLNEIVGKTDFDLFPEDIARKYRSEDEWVLENRAPMYVGDEQMPYREMIITVSTRKVPLLDHQKELKGIIGLSFDISERRAMENALKESRRTLVTLLSNLTGMAYRLTNDGNWTIDFVSEGCLELTGYDSLDLSGFHTITLKDLIPKQDRDNNWKKIRKALKLKKPFQNTYCMKTANGDIKWVWEQGRGIFDDEGKLVAIEGFITDISEQKRVEDALMESERKYRTTLDAMGDIIIVVDRDYQIVLVNQAFRSFAIEYGLSDAFIGLNIFSVLPFLTGDLRQSFLQVFEEGQVLLAEDHFSSEGWEFYTETKYIPIFEGSETVQCLCQIRDITNRKRMEEKLAENESRFRTIFEKSPLGIGILDADGIVLEVNESCKVFFHLESTSLIQGLSIFDDPHLPDEIKDNLRNRQAVDFEIDIDDTTVISKHAAYKSPRPKLIVRVIITPLPEVPYLHRGGYLFIMQDITDRIRAEIELKQAFADLASAHNKLQKLDATKTDFLSITSHELKTPLTSILGYTELLGEELLGPLNEKQHKALGGILRNTQHLSRIVSDVLDYSRMESKHLLINVAPANAAELIYQTAASIQQLLVESGCKLEIMVPKDLPTIDLDFRRICQVLYHLLDNAVNFSPDGGTITVTIVMENMGLRFTVQDQGVGIALEEQDRIFDKFYQVSNTNKRHIGGLGLGLSISKVVIEAHGGNIELFSIPGKGATFSFWLPIKHSLTQV